MPLVRYNATRSLVTGVASGQEVIYALPARYAGQIRQHAVASTTRVSMSGRRENYHERTEDAWAVSTKPLTAAEADELVMFLDSVEHGEGFDFDPDVIQGPNVLVNPGFERGVVAPWEISGGASAFTVNSTAGMQVSGSYAGYATLTINVSAVLFQQPPSTSTFAAEAAQNWFVQGHAKRDESSLPNRNFQLTTRWGTSSDVLITEPTVATALSATSGYQRLLGIVVAPATTAKLRLRGLKAAPTNTDETGKWLFDDAILALLSAAPSWRTCELMQFGYSEPRESARDSMLTYQFSIVEVP